jgi:type II secretion system protein G
VIHHVQACSSGSAYFSQAQSQIHQLSGYIKLFKANTGRYPTANEGLEVLIHKPLDISEDKWAGPFLESIPVDPWDGDYVYELTKDGFVIYSEGMDPDDEADDIYKETSYNNEFYTNITFAVVQFILLFSLPLALFLEVVVFVKRKKLKKSVKGAVHTLFVVSLILFFFGLMSLTLLC